MMIEQLLDQEQESIVDVEKLSVTFGNQEVLKDITLRIPPGQTLALLGESGCGKTVLMKSIIGLVKPTVGTIEFDGENINQLTERQLSRMRLRYGFIFQNAALFDSMTIGQNVAFPLRQHGRFSDDQIREMVLSRLSEVGLPDSVVFKKPAELSGGMRKRVGLARALIMNPELIMYDEPTAGLDPVASTVVEDLIRSMHDPRFVRNAKGSEGSRESTASGAIQLQEGCGVSSYVVVTHQHSTIRRSVDRIIFLNQGRVVWEGSVADFERTEEPIVKQFRQGSLDGPIAYV